MTDAIPQYTADSAKALDADKLRQNLAHLERIGEAIDGWDSKLDARQGGYSLHVKFGARPGVFTATQHAELMQRCPAMLADALRRLIAIAEADSSEKVG